MSALNNEILHEEGAVSYDSAPSAEPSDFTRSVNGATIILQKQYNNETIRVRFVEHHFLTYYLHHGVIYCSSIRSSYLTFGTINTGIYYLIIPCPFTWRAVSCELLTINLLYYKVIISNKSLQHVIIIPV